MEKLIFLFFIGMFYFGECFARDKPSDALVHVIPEPVSVKVKQGHFQLNKSTTIVYTDEQAKDIGSMMAGQLNPPTGYHIRVESGRNKNQDNAIIMRLNKSPNTTIGPAGYILEVSSRQVLISANRPRGLFYGMQTLMQLFPPNIESRTAISSNKWEIPCVSIIDYPRFKWRGLMLDVSRHFFSKEYVEKYIDEMSKYKLNIFHWHLTDLNGWRIQIKGLPKLTEVGAWRVPRKGMWGTFDPAYPGEKATYGGYYTQQDIRDVVAYAKKRFITIVPEIDVPDHSLALIASYPNLSCTKLQYPVDPGTSLLNVEQYDNVLCVANDSTWIVLNKIFDQVAELFPGEYIHVGGDEVHTRYWESDSKSRALMKMEGITNVKGLQDYFERKLEQVIISKGKKMIGWYLPSDKSKLNSGYAFMCWKDISTAIKAIKLGHNVVMAPNRYTYLDYSESSLPITKCYMFEPVPKGVNEKYILGGEGCLWTERVPNKRQVEYKSWPRAMALSEVFWSQKTRRSWDDFATRMLYRLNYLDVAQMKYSRDAFNPVISTFGGEKQLELTKVKITTNIPGLVVYYRFDGTDPDKFSPKYNGEPLKIPMGATQIRAISYYKGKPIGRQKVLTLY